MTIKFSLLTTLAMLGCSSTGTSPPEKVYDFSSRPLTTTVPAPSASHSVKAQMRRVIDQLQPALSRCTTGTSGDLEITLRIELSPELPAVLDNVEVAYPNAAAAACAREVLASIDLSAIETRESAVWVVHTPFVVAANQ